MYNISAKFDEEASVWIAEGDNLPGLVTEHPTLDGLVGKLESMIPDLLDARGEPTTGSFVLMIRKAF